MEEAFPNSMHLPRGLMVKPSSTNNKKLGIYSYIIIKAGVKYGPFKGEKKHISDVLDDSFAWMIRNFSGRPLFFVDASNIESANWMRFVKCTGLEYNLVIHQRRKKIFFKVTKDIHPGDELLIGFHLSRDSFEEVIEHDVNLNNDEPICNPPNENRCTPCTNVNEDTPSTDVNKYPLTTGVDGDNFSNDVNIATERNMFEAMSSTTVQSIPEMEIRVTWPSGSISIDEPLSKVFKSYVKLVPLDISEKVKLEFQHEVDTLEPDSTWQHNNDVIDNAFGLVATNVNTTSFQDESSLCGNTEDQLVQNCKVSDNIGEYFYQEPGNCHSTVNEDAAAVEEVVKYEENKVVYDTDEGTICAEYVNERNLSDNTTGAHTSHDVSHTKGVFQISEHALNMCVRHCVEPPESYNRPSCKKGITEELRNNMFGVSNNVSKQPDTIYSTDMNLAKLNLNDYNFHESQRLYHEGYENEKEERTVSKNITGNGGMSRHNNEVKTDDVHVECNSRTSDLYGKIKEEFIDVTNTIEDVLKNRVERFGAIDGGKCVQELNAAETIGNNYAELGQELKGVGTVGNTDGELFRQELKRVGTIGNNYAKQFGKEHKTAESTGDIVVDKCDGEVKGAEIIENNNGTTLEVRAAGTSESNYGEKMDNKFRETEIASHEKGFENKVKVNGGLTQMSKIKNGSPEVIQHYCSIELNEEMKTTQIGKSVHQPLTMTFCEENALDLQLPKVPAWKRSSGEPQNMSNVSGLKRRYKSGINEMNKGLKQRKRNQALAGFDRKIQVSESHKNKERNKFTCWMCNADYASYDLYLDHVMVNCTRRIVRRTEAPVASNVSRVSPQPIETHSKFNQIGTGYNHGGMKKVSPCYNDFLTPVGLTPDMNTDFSGALIRFASLAKLERSGVMQNNKLERSERSGVMQNNMLQSNRSIKDPSTVLNLQSRPPIIDSLHSSYANKSPLFSEKHNFVSGALDFRDRTWENESLLNSNTRKRNYQEGQKLLASGLKLKVGYLPTPFFPTSNTPAIIPQINRAITGTTSIHDARGGPPHGVPFPLEVESTSTGISGHGYSAAFNRRYQSAVNTSIQIRAPVRLQGEWLPNRKSLHGASVNGEPIPKLLPPKRMPILLRHGREGQSMQCSLDPERWKKQSRSYKHVLATSK